MTQDGGVNWKYVSSTIHNGMLESVSCIRHSPDAICVVAGTDLVEGSNTGRSFIYETDDSGANWSRKNSGIGKRFLQI